MNKRNIAQKASEIALTILGPIWLPVYWIWQLLVGLVGVSYYLVVERTGHVLFPSRVSKRMELRIRWFMVPLLIVLLVPALVLQLIVALWHLFVWWHAMIGRWQTGVTATFPAVVFGVVSELVLVLVLIGSFHQPLAWRVAGYQGFELKFILDQYWYRSDQFDPPIRTLLAGPFLIGTFWLVLMPTILTRFSRRMKKFLFVPACVLSIAALYHTLRSFTPLTNELWLTVAKILFLSVVLIAMMVLARRTLHRSTALRQFVWFSAIRLLEKKRIALFSLAAVTLCTAMLLIIISVMGGFVDQIKKKSHGLMGDIILEGDQIRGFPYYQDFIEKIKSDPKLGELVVEATPIIHTGGLLRTQSPHNPDAFWTNFVQVQGIDLAGKIAVSKFGEGLYRYRRNPDAIVLDEPLQPRDSPDAEILYGMIYGLDIKYFSYRDSDGQYYRYIPDYWTTTISVSPVAASGRILDATAPARTQKFYMLDDSRTGIFDVDSASIYVGFDVLQNMLYMNEMEQIDGTTLPARTSQIHIKLSPGVPLSQETVNKFRDAWSDYSARFNNPLVGMVQVNTWESYNAMLIAAVENEKRLMIMLFGIISIVAVFLILAIFYMIVMEKTRDIGVLKSIGASSAQIAAIFLTYGGVIGFVGSIMGTALGYYFVLHINDVQNWLIRVFGWRVWNREVYAFDEIPSQVQFDDITKIIVAAIVASVIGALIPAIRAARMNPVEALRYE